MEQLNWTVECVAFVIMIGLSVVVGLYYGCVQGKQNTVSEYLLGGRHMAVLPITMSLITSQLSGISLLGIPSEVYSYGTQYLIFTIDYVICSYIIIYIYLPVFYELQSVSVFEYLELRFDSKIRGFLSIIYAISVILHVPVVIYVPAMAFSYVTGLNLYYFTLIICGICIFYTTIGGLKAVVWTDAIQSFFTAVSIIIVIVLGLIRIGGFNNMITANQESDRIEFFSSVQRFVALPTFNEARKSLIFFAFGMGVIKLFSGMTGLLIYATYKDCDPTLANYIDNDKHIVPFYIVDVASKIPGTTGLFIAGVVSAALSSMSAQLNTLSGTIYEDLIVKTMNVKPSDLTASIIIKFTVVVIGVICTFLVYMIEKMNGIIQVSISLNSVTIGAVISVFTLGITFPRANSRGVMYGMLSSIVIMVWIVSGAQIAMYNGELKFVKKNVSIAGCPDNVHFRNHSEFSGLYRMNADVYVNPNVNKIFTLSYMHYNTIGTIIALVVGIVVSLMFPTEQNIDPKLLAPCIRKCMYLKNSTKTKCEANKTEEYQLVSQNTKL
ncbi:sodium-coupled monocarboxylate transporter 1-like isoform X2 [Sipha flava]|uniref:Sodium-coupled monocarboxylate transporter 1-like isoform X2 n=1 Tax=Sipha flava TaxID=143950 RepID=A0A8B8F5Y5_9HEMI|nr:sodium-coupled monocarboxylate transporter 1-like isoform X2 [Sipha flava]